MGVKGSASPFVVHPRAGGRHHSDVLHRPNSRPLHVARRGQKSDGASLVAGESSSTGPLSWLSGAVKGIGDKIGGISKSLENMVAEGRALYVQELAYPLLMATIGDGAEVGWPKEEFSIELDTLEAGAMRQHCACTFDVTKSGRVFKVRAEGMAVCPQEMMSLVSLRIDGHEVPIEAGAALPEPATPYVPPRKPSPPPPLPKEHKSRRTKRPSGFGKKDDTVIDV